VGFLSPTGKQPKLAPINARAETLSTSPMFRDAFRRHRCLVVADGFYEWRKNDGRTRTPFFIRLKSGRPFGFAGIWSIKHGEKGSRLATCAIATCPTNELMAQIHDRMPVILPEGSRDRWLDPTARETELRGLLVPLTAEDLNAYEVSGFVNSPRNDSPECVRPSWLTLRDLFGDGFEQSTILRTGPDGLTHVITRTSWIERESIPAHEVERAVFGRWAAFHERRFASARQEFVCMLRWKRSGTSRRNRQGQSAREGGAACSSRSFGRVIDHAACLRIAARARGRCHRFGVGACRDYRGVVEGQEVTTANDCLLHEQARELLSDERRWPSSNPSRSRSGLRDARREFESAFCPGGIVVAKRREGSGDGGRRMRHILARRADEAEGRSRRNELRVRMRRPLSGG
jgi:putative SOS response-associated peptidase YedK